MNKETEGSCAAIALKEPSLIEKIIARAKSLFARKQESNLVRHAEYELRRAGLFSKDADYEGMIAEAVMKLVKVHAAEGHSGMSHSYTLDIFNRVANFKVLTPITNDPSEWGSVQEFYGPGSKPVWQNRRQSSCFSNDGGVTYYDINDKERTIKVSAQYGVSK